MAGPSAGIWCVLLVNPQLLAPPGDACTVHPVFGRLFQSDETAGSHWPTPVVAGIAVPCSQTD